MHVYFASWVVGVLLLGPSGRSGHRTHGPLGEQFRGVPVWAGRLGAGNKQLALSLVKWATKATALEQRADGYDR